MVEVFKTNITSNKKANDVLNALQSQFPHLGINFDLEDCDNILRIESFTDADICIDRIYKIIRCLGFEIDVLPDTVNIGK